MRRYYRKPKKQKIKEALEFYKNLYGKGPDEKKKKKPTGLDILDPKGDI